MLRTFFITLVILGSQGLYGQTMEIRIPQLKDATTVYLARYYGDKLFYVDTTVHHQGVTIFEDENRPRGLYAIVLPGTRFFEVLLDKEDVVMTISDTSRFNELITIQKSENNIALRAYTLYMRDYEKKLTELGKKYEAANGDPKKERAVSKKIRALNKKLLVYRKKLATQYEPYYISQVLRLTMDVEVPPPPKTKEGEPIDSFFTYNFYIKHFWDGIDLTDPALAYTPVYHHRLNRYFSEDVLIQSPDTIIKYADQLLSKMDQQDQDNKVFQYTLNFIATKYEASKIMNMDKVLWYLGKMYYCPPNSKAYWMPSVNLEKFCDRVEHLGKIVCGNKAVPLILTDTTETNWINFYNIPAEYMVLFFWDPNCGHCKQDAPKLQQLYEQKFKERGIEIVAIAQATGDDFEVWKEFIRNNNLSFTNIGLTPKVYNQAMIDPMPLLKHTTIESINFGDTYDVYSTPKIFILDKNKVILYKQLIVPQVELILDELTGHGEDEKLFPMPE